MKIELNLTLDLTGDPLQLAESMARLSAFVGGARAFWNALHEETASTEQQPPTEPAGEPIKPTPTIVAVTDVNLDIAPISSTNGHAPAGGRKQTTSRNIPFDEFDRLVRAEMKKLNRGGVMPGATYWNECRDPQLPTMAAVLQRYRCANPSALADLLGYLPPPRHRREKEG